MVPWVVGSHGHEYATSPWALYVVAGALLIAFVAVALALLPPAGTPDDYPLEGLGRLCFGSAVAAVCFVAAPVLAWWLSDAPVFGGGEARTYIVFRRLLRLEVLWAAAAGGTVALALGLMRRRRIGERFARVGALAAMGALALAGAAATHATLLVQVDCLPRIDKVGHGYLHVGRPRALRFRTSCGPAYEPPAPVELTADAPGELSLPVAADYPFVHVTRVFPLRAGAETGPERLAVREGNTWVYQRTEVSRLARHFVEQRRDVASDGVTLSIGEARLEDGLRIFPLSVRFETADEAETFEVVAWNGSLERYEDQRMQTLIGPGRLDEPTESFLLPGRCQGAPPSESPNAPAECKVKVGMAAGLGSAMLRILTLGTASYIPGREVYVLESARWGPEDGAEVPIVPAPGPTS